MPASDPEDVPDEVPAVPLDVPDDVPPVEVPDAVPELLAFTPEDDAPFPLELPLVPDPALLLPLDVPLVDTEAVPPSCEEPSEGDEVPLEHPYTIVLTSET
jgi:hypothetical protein